MVVGVDIGLTGGIAFVGKPKHYAFSMPVFKKGISSDYDIHVIIDKLKQQQHEIDMVVIEQAGFRPQQNINSSRFSSRGQAIFETICCALDYPYVIVPPGTWKRKLKLLNADKKASIAMARSIFPSAVREFTGPQGGIPDGPCEALLIAYWWLESRGGYN